MRYFLCLFLLVNLSACGIKGALYLPEQRYPQKNVPVAPTTDTSTTAPSATQPINKETK